jgi:hypothetical protein
MRCNFLTKVNSSQSSARSVRTICSAHAVGKQHRNLGYAARAAFGQKKPSSFLGKMADGRIAIAHRSPKDVGTIGVSSSVRSCVERFGVKADLIMTSRDFRF